MNFFSGSTVVRVTRPNLLNWNENLKTLAVFFTKTLNWICQENITCWSHFKIFRGMHTPAALRWSAFSGHLSELPFTKSCIFPLSCAGGCVGVRVRVSGMNTRIDLKIIKMILWLPLGNQKRPPERGVRRHSDSVLSLPPRTDENSLITLTQVKNQVKSLEERMEAVETQMVPFEKGKFVIKGIFL